MSRIAMSGRDTSGLVSRFQLVCETLKQDRFADRLSKPLAFWVLPNDRRLPLALLNRTIDQLIHSTFDELAATPGIGRKKISSLVNLLVRATSDEPPSVPFGDGGGSSEEVSLLPPPVRIGPGARTETFDAYLVSEALWSQWTDVVRQSTLGNESIGRVADSLRGIPTVIWTKTLGEYEDLTLSQIRGLRTHGEKRVRCVMQVMHKAYCTLQSFPNDSDPTIRRRLGSQRIVKISHWIEQLIQNDRIPPTTEVREQLVDPILDQIDTDCGESVHKVAQQRLGLEGETLSVREQAQAIGVTRARIYQLLEDCHKVIEVRWPNGRSQLDRLTARLGSQSDSMEDPELFIATRQLCFPERPTDRLDAPHVLNHAPHFMP